MSRKQRRSQRIAFSLQGAEAVFEDVKILGGECNESSLAKFRGEIMIGPMIARNHILRPAFQAMLANHDGAFFVLLQILWPEQDPVSDDFREDIHHDFVRRPLLGLLPNPRPHIRRTAI